MADEADIAKEYEEMHLQHALANRKPGPKLVPSGFCHNCRDRLPAMLVEGKATHVQLFCDSHCSEDWERAQKLKALRG